MSHGEALAFLNCVADMTDEEILRAGLQQGGSTNRLRFLTDFILVRLLRVRSLWKWDTPNAVNFACHAVTAKL
jgi:hypothetical protein